MGLLTGVVAKNNVWRVVGTIAPLIIQGVSSKLFNSNQKMESAIVKGTSDGEKSVQKKVFTDLKNKDLKMEEEVKNKIVKLFKTHAAHLNTKAGAADLKKWVAAANKMAMQSLSN